MLNEGSLVIEIEGGCRQEITFVSKVVGMAVLLGALYDGNIMGICIAIMVLNYSTYSKQMEVNESVCIIRQKSLLYRNCQTYEAKSIKEVDFFVSDRGVIAFLIMGEVSRKVAFKAVNRDEVIRFIENRWKIKTNLYKR